MNRTWLFALATAIAMLTTGCASVTGSPTQNMALQTRDQFGDEVTGAQCELYNNKGRWYVVSPGSVTIQKSNQDMQVSCSKEGSETGRQAVVSEVLGSMYGNIIIGGGIGALIDHNSGAAYEYPSTIRVTMNSLTKKEPANPPPPAPVPVAVGASSSVVRTLGPLAINTGKKPQVGDEWEYLSQDKLFGKQKKLVWRVKSVESNRVLEELLVDDLQSAQWMFDSKLDMLAVPTDTGFIFGQHWETQSKFPSIKVKGGGECERRDCYVEGKMFGPERINIAAGTFDAIRFDAVLTLNYLTLKPQARVTVWYSEKDRRLLKQVATLRSSGMALDETVELQAARAYR